ncbi:FAD-dependent oxidoreductase [Bradyrhizobium sp. AUGA SZCCT0240]|uniref:FAD-dependent oxidoreductase n=1 Tax=Bradyrhizobium sp. AUGA SZCCT0240 TaxID=2807669 RepID=UPI001BAA98C9|nr:FAD-binding protein [Bradyrhizobium sp. AUGA SZCCT0240]MBR1252317.1 FAD-dependent oxidoreductase [Bradyrhizobium sp. AUGA SZCCT0240]
MIQDLTDVLVCGGGLAGHCAALTAAEGGAEVLFVEKMESHGGSSLQAGGGFAFAGTDLQAARGIADGAEQLKRDLIEAGGGKSDPALVEAYVANQLETYEWLRSNGVEFSLGMSSTPGAVSRVHGTRQGAAVTALHQRVAREKRIRFAARAATKRLMTKGGTVIGALLDIGGVPTEVETRRAVVLATGGFSRSPRLLETYAPGLSAAFRLGGTGNQGDGLLMASRVGAGQTDMGYIAATFGVAASRFPELGQGPDEDAVLLFAIYRGAIMVNRDGVRFADESANYKSLSGLCASQPDGIAFQIFDAKVMAQSAPSSSINDFEGAFKKGLILQAPDLDQLGQMIGIPRAKLRQAIIRYNRDLLEGGFDREFGRRAPAYGSGAPLSGIDTPPFYAFPCANAVTATYCGLTVNSRMEVLDVFGEQIPGLLAAGEILGGFHGRSYLSGSALAKAAISGRIAGLSAAGQPLSERCCCAQSLPDPAI